MYLCEMLNENENEFKFKFKFENVGNADFDFDFYDYADSCNGYSCPQVIHLLHSQQYFFLNGIDTELAGNKVLRFIFSVDLRENNIIDK